MRNGTFALRGSGEAVVFAFLFESSSESVDLPYALDSPAGLAARWVRWAASSDAVCNPVADMTGRHAHVNQPKDVWFLAGCFGGSVKRSCHVPANRKLFFPAFNLWLFRSAMLGWIYGAIQPPDIGPATGYLQIDGRDISIDYICTPKQFIVQGSAGNPATGTCNKMAATVSGFWKEVAPLAPGEHEICFGGADGSGFTVDAIYDITIR